MKLVKEAEHYEQVMGSKFVGARRGLIKIAKHRLGSNVVDDIGGSLGGPVARLGMAIEARFKSDHMQITPRLPEGCGRL